MNPLYNSCQLCPQICNVNRNDEELGICQEGNQIKIAAANIHFGEEPLLTQRGGSGTIFFTGCTLKCNFCQNYQISQEGTGKIVNPAEFIEICFALEKNGAENINLVTGTQFIPTIIDSIVKAKKDGLSIPIIWNSSGFETVASIQLLAPIIDIWLPDIKTINPNRSKQFFKNEKYPISAKNGILEMIKLTPLKYKNEALKKGVIVRHLILPNFIESSKEVLEWFSKNIAQNAILSLMSQYTPVNEKSIPGKITKQEYDTILNYLDNLNIENGFFQELDIDSSWRPNFNNVNPFTAKLSRPIWHWKEGFVNK